MNQRFYRIFDNNYRRFRISRRGDRNQSLAEEITERIDNATRQAGLEKTLRPDAKLFLLVNFYEMIGRPVLRERQADPQSIFFALDEDLETILLSASRNKSLHQEITGGDIVRSLGQVYDRLKLTRIDIWG